MQQHIIEQNLSERPSRTCTTINKQHVGVSSVLGVAFDSPKKCICHTVHPSYLLVIQHRHGGFGFKQTGGIPTKMMVYHGPLEFLWAEPLRTPPHCLVGGLNPSEKYESQLG